MIRPDHPVVRAMAEEAARTAFDALRAECARSLGTSAGLVTWETGDTAKLHTDYMVGLLLNFARPATRDAWTRWIRNARLRAAQESGEAFADPGEVPAIFRDTDRLRDDPEALEAAVSAALEAA